jgi:hypothetical protein
MATTLMMIFVRVIHAPGYVVPKGAEHAAEAYEEQIDHDEHDADGRAISAVDTPSPRRLRANLRPKTLTLRTSRGSPPPVRRQRTGLKGPAMLSLPDITMTGTPTTAPRAAL